MGLDDLLGLLFLFFFIVLPALQSLLRRGQQMPPDFEPDEILLPGEERRPKTQPRQPPPKQSGAPARPATPAAAPAQPPTSSAPAPRPLVSQPSTSPRPSKGRRPNTLEEIERERLTRPSRPAAEPAQPSPVQTSPSSARPKAQTTEQWTFSTSPRAILNGVVWHQVLAEPRSQYWRRVRKPKR